MTTVSRKLDSVQTVDEICQALRVESAWLAHVARQIAANGYSPFELVTGLKRRTIHRPRPWLKAIQRGLHDHVLSRFAVSDAVFSKRGRGVVDNARQHLTRAYLVVLDIQDCFPSTRVHMVRDAFRRAGFDEPAVGLLTRLVTYQDMLPQGPPSSPGVLNLVFEPVDDALADLAVSRGATYTRYMDDLAFSADAPLDTLAEAAERVVRRRGYRINTRKRRVWGPEDRHTITKIVVTSTLNPEPDYLQALATEIERFRADKGSMTLNQLSGRVAWIEALDPTLGQTLRRALVRPRLTPHGRR